MATNYSHRGHSGKVRYATRKMAKKGARRLEQLDRVGGHISAYRCGMCDGYHIGHNNEYALSVLMEYMPNRQLDFSKFNKAV